MALKLYHMKASDEIILRDKIQRFIQAFGLLRNQTPCGKPISVSMAHALMHLAVATEETTQSSIQKKLNLDKSNVTRLCTSLEEDGFIEQYRSSSDRRARILKLTPKGDRLSHSLLSASQERFKKVLAHIPKKFRSQLFQNFDLLTSAIIEANRAQVEGELK
jgi:DNA-binding MarR family transcriptional regulator